MKTLSFRLALWYSLVSTITLLGLLSAGYYLLSQHLIRGLDLLNIAEFERIKAVASRSGAKGLQGLYETSSSASGTLPFYFEVTDSSGRLLARSSNLDADVLPAGGVGTFTARLFGLGELHGARFESDGYRITIATPLKPVHDVMEGYAEVALVLLCLVLLASLISGLLLSQIALRPVRLIREAANRIRSDNLGERIPVSDAKDEISDLAKLLNEMFDRLEASFDQIRRFSAEVSHELKTPLSLLRLQTEKLLTDGGLNAAQEEGVHVQLEEISGLNQIIEELLFLSRAEARAIAPNYRTENPRAFLMGFVLDARTLSEHSGIRFKERIAGEEEVRFDPQWVRRVLLNLLANALKVSPAGSLLTLESEFTVDAWRLALEDEGPGVPADRRALIFERFVRLQPESTSGSGLGLAICRSIVEMHHGTIRAEEGARKGGLHVIVEIPIRLVSLPEPTLAPIAHEMD